MRYPIWTTKAGAKIPINKMADDHLVNAIRMLEKNSQRIALDTPYPSFGGEMAQYYADQDWEREVSLTAEERYPILTKLKELAKTRGLDWTKTPKPLAEKVLEMATTIKHLEKQVKKLKKKVAVIS